MPVHRARGIPDVSVAHERLSKGYASCLSLISVTDHPWTRARKSFRAILRLHGATGHTRVRAATATGPMASGPLRRGLRFMACFLIDRVCRARHRRHSRIRWRGQHRARAFASALRTRMRLAVLRHRSARGEIAALAAFVFINRHDAPPPTCQVKAACRCLGSRTWSDPMHSAGCRNRKSVSAATASRRRWECRPRR